MKLTQAVKVRFQLDAPKYGTKDTFITWYPRVLEAKLTKNNHLVADELTVTLGWREAGIDPRILKYGRGKLWVWDSNHGPFDETRHLRFSGIVKTAKRSSNDDWMKVELTLHDYTSLFIDMKPFPTEGMPEWTDTLQVVWDKICRNTGWYDPDTGKIVSSVEALRKKIIYSTPTALLYRDKPIGVLVPDRFHKTAKPTPGRYQDAWSVWKWITGALGLISYIDGHNCIVSDTVEHFDQSEAPIFTYGQNIYDLEEVGDTGIATKGVLVKSMNTLTGKVMESHYPRPGDERIKTKRAAVGKRSDEGANVTENEVSAEYEEFSFNTIQTQEMLDRAARAIYEERSRQQLEGSFKTSDMTVRRPSPDDNPETVDILGLTAGDPIAVYFDGKLQETLRSMGSVSEQFTYLTDVIGYDRSVAQVIILNLDVPELAGFTFHIDTVEMDLGEEKLEFTVKFHNLMVLDTIKKRTGAT